MSRPRIAASAALIAASTALLLAPAASASQGSVPAEVAQYAADADGLLSRLDDLFGVGSSGKGIDFDDTTAAGQLNRVFVFTEEFLAGTKTDLPIERANLWSAPITIAEKPVGLATIWINPVTVEPELAEFVQDIDSAAALADVPTDAYLVGDGPRGAWFTLVDATLTPLVPGSSGVTGTVSLEEYQRRLADAAADAPLTDESANSGTILSVAIIAAAALAVIGVLLVPLIRGRSRGRTTDAAAPPTALEPPAAAQSPPANPARKPAVKKAPAAPPAVKKAPAGKPRVPKPPVDPA